jgi:hypothetical protein
MEEFKKFLLKTFSSKSDMSSKRLISFLAFGMMTIGFLSNLYFGFKVEEHMFKSMEWIVEIGLGTILLERFGKNNNNGGEPQPPKTQTQIVSTEEEKNESVDMPTGEDPEE